MAALVLDGETIVEQCMNVSRTVLEVREMDPPALKDTNEEKDAAEAQDADLLRIPVPASAFETEVCEYRDPEIYESPVSDAVLDVLSTEELCEVVAAQGWSEMAPGFSMRWDRPAILRAPLSTGDCPMSVWRTARPGCVCRRCPL